MNPNLNFTCLQCTHSIFPFISLDNKQFYTYADTGVILNEDSDLGLDPSPEQKLLMDKITNQLKSYRFDISDFDGDDDFEEVPECKYYLPDDFKKENFSKLDNFSILHLNVHSIERHIDEIQVLLNLLKFEFDVLCFSESKIMEGTNPKSSINLEGYQDPVGMHTKATKGGVLIYVKNGISFVPRNDLDIQKDKKLESCFIEIQNPNHHNSIVGVVYRHPTMDECEFINDHLCELTQRLSKENKPLFITGDWNFNLLEFSNHEETLKFYETMMSNLLAPAITIPTRISNSGRGTLIDNIFTNSILPDKTSGNLSVNISDHLPSFLIVPVENKCTNTQKKTQYKRDTKNFSNDDFIMDYLDIDWNSELEIDKNDVNHTTDIFFTKMCAIIDKHMPLRKLTIKERKQQSKPWITPAIVEKINDKNKLYKKFMKSKRKEDRLKFSKLKNEITSLTRKSKEEYYKKYFEKNNKNSKKIWNGIKEIINIKQKSSSLPTSLKDKDKILTNQKEIAEHFNCYFSGIADNILKKRKFEGSHSYQEYLKHPLPNSHMFFDCDPEEVECLISSLEMTKASGPFSIPVNVLHMLKNDISIPLSKIFNLSLRTGTHPDCLKLAMVIPIHKKGSKLEVGNYRPISLLSNINKLLEKIVHERTYNFLEKFNCLYKYQFGFRKSHSTNHALIEITEKIRKALDSRKFACGIFVDLQKAFDTVNHEILLKKLEHYGIRGTSNSWFRSYLDNRKQLVSLNGDESKTQVMKHGVPQGSVLGPLLFIIYINDLHNAVRYSQSYHFADDTHLLNISDSPKKIQKQLNIDLKLLYNWLLAKKIH